MPADPTQMPTSAEARPTPAVGGGLSQGALAEGLRSGQAWAQTALDAFEVWAAENPGQLILLGVATGFVLGKLLQGPRRREG